MALRVHKNIRPIMSKPHDGALMMAFNDGGRGCVHESCVHDCADVHHVHDDVHALHERLGSFNGCVHDYVHDHAHGYVHDCDGHARHDDDRA
ncbi:hypothetical protein [Moraxella lacunata]|uniref:hypothetical protein n=1 Tax=Moraxella lacunata TaxID=477 RepID=UPI003EE1283E